MDHCGTNCFIFAPISFKDRKATFVAWTLSSLNVPTDKARELFKPSKEAESVLGLIFKNFGTSEVEIFLV